MNKNIQDNFMNMRIDVNEKFTFHCTQCGACCKNRDDIILNPKDLFRIAQKLASTPMEIAQQYCEVYIGDSSRLPVVRLRSIGADHRCPFLKDNTCAVHDVKPVICAMFPIGRVLVSKMGKQNPNKLEYIFVDPGCGDNTEEHTVKDWLQDSGVPLHDAFFTEWSTTIIELCQIIQSIERCIPEIMKKDLGNGLLNILYFEYDLSQEFHPQFQRNTNLLLKSLHQLLNTLKVADVFTDSTEKL